MNDDKRGMKKVVTRLGMVGVLQVLALCGVLGSLAPARAAYVVTFSEVGGNVVATGTGSINTSSLSLLCSSCSTSFGNGVRPVADLLYIVPGGTSPAESAFTGFSGPSSFGTGTSFVSGSSSSGPDFVFDRPYLYLPGSYVSGTAFSNSETWDGATFASLGLTPGAYIWSWGSGAGADSFEIDIAVPEPASLALVGGALLGLAATRRRRRTRVAR